MAKPEIRALSNPPADEHVAACGLFCTNCRSFKSGKCPGCQIAPSFARCSVRACCADQGIACCADCSDFAAPRDYRECKNLNNLFAKLFAIMFQSDRPGALAMLRDQGRDHYLKDKRDRGKM